MSRNRKEKHTSTICGMAVVCDCLRPRSDSEKGALQNRFSQIRLWYYDYSLLMGSIMKKMAAGAFKTNCLAVMDEVQAKHETVVITKHGKPVAKLVPVSTETDEIFNFLAGKGIITGDIVSPALSPAEWGDLE
jgi:prevent-host-death family protein